MKTRCPCCGAENSLDALIAHEQARQSLWTLANIGGAMTLGITGLIGHRTRSLLRLRVTPESQG